MPPNPTKTNESSILNDLPDDWSNGKPGSSTDGFDVAHDDPPLQELRRSNRHTIPKIIPSMMSFSVLFHTHLNSGFYESKMACRDAELLKKAINDELEALISKNTWVLVYLSEGRKLMKYKFACKITPGYESAPSR